MKDEPIPPEYYLKGPSEFAAPVEKEDFSEVRKTFHEMNKKLMDEIIGHKEENARLRSLIQEAFEYGWFRSKDNLYSVIWEQFKKDNNL